jgi:uncharacterized protein YndB with AHSA1/START domain
MTTAQQGRLEATTEIDATPAQVWALISDPRRMSAFSPQVVRTFVRGRGPVGTGTTFLNLNRRGPVFWPTQAEVVRCEPHREFAFRIKENWTVWVFTLEPTADGGTRLTQHRETPEGISRISTSLTTVALGGVPRFTEELQQGMHETLAKIKQAAETAR